MFSLLRQKLQPAVFTVKYDRHGAARLHSLAFTIQTPVFNAILLRLRNEARSEPPAFCVKAGWFRTQSILHGLMYATGIGLTVGQRLLLTLRVYMSTLSIYHSHIMPRIS